MLKNKKIDITKEYSLQNFKDIFKNLKSHKKIGNIKNKIQNFIENQTIYQIEKRGTTNFFKINQLKQTVSDKDLDLFEKENKQDEKTEPKEDISDPKQNLKTESEIEVKNEEQRECEIITNKKEDEEEIKSNESEDIEKEEFGKKEVIEIDETNESDKSSESSEKTDERENMKQLQKDEEPNENNIF